MNARRLDLDRQPTVPAEACYWSVLDVSVLPRRHRMDPQRLGFLFEDQLPCAIDDLHAVYRPTSQDRVIGCAVARDRMEEMLKDDAGSSLSLTPKVVPKFIREDSVDARSFNLLTGDYEPYPVRHRRRRWLISMALLAAIIATLLTVGFERRQLAVDNAIQTLRTDAHALITHAIGPAPGSSSLPSEQRLISALRRLEQTRNVNQQSGGESEPVDLVHAFFELLRKWPDELHINTELISMTSESITIRGRLESSADVQSLADALGRVDGWAMRQPQIASTRDGVQAMLILAPIEETENTQ